MAKAQGCSWKTTSLFEHETCWLEGYNKVWKEKNKLNEVGGIAYLDITCVCVGWKLYSLTWRALAMNIALVFLWLKLVWHAFLHWWLMAWLSTTISACWKMRSGFCHGCIYIHDIGLSSCRRRLIINEEINVMSLAKMTIILVILSCYGGCAIYTINKNINDGFINVENSICFA